MATRPTKTAGNRTYTLEVAAGATTIKASEIDADLNEIYANITNINIALGAAIAYAKLALTGGIVNADVNAAAAIAGSKLAAGAAVHAIQSANSATGLSGITVEQTLATLPAITTRGGRVLLTGNASLSAVVLAGVLAVVSVRWYRGVTLIYQVDYKISAAGAGSEIPIPTPLFVDTIAAGTYVYALKALTSTNSLETSVANPGTLFAVELT